MSEWQPIETAPKDGTIILVTPGLRVPEMVKTWPKGTVLMVTPARWYEGRGERHDPYDSGWYAPTWFHYVDRVDGTRSSFQADLEPTHWMPLPEPPEVVA